MNMCKHNQGGGEERDRDTHLLIRLVDAIALEAPEGPLAQLRPPKVSRLGP